MLSLDCRVPLPRPTFSSSTVVDSFTPSEKQYKFLLVDDNLINLRIFSRILRKLFPKSTVSAIQDSTSIQMTESFFRQYDCIFLDIDMPIVTGLDIASKVRGFLNLDTKGLIAVTTRSLHHDLDLYESLGFDHCFPKPVAFSYPYLLEKIEEVVKVRAALKP